MWSCRFNKIISSRTQKSITNSTALSEDHKHQSTIDRNPSSLYSYFFTNIGRWRHLAELILVAHLLAVILTLVEAQSWSAFSLHRLLLHVLYINWILLSFAAATKVLSQKFLKVSVIQGLCAGFLLLQLIILITTVSLNFLLHWGTYYGELSGLNVEILFEDVVLHLSYGILFGLLCFRYLYLREQWLRQQHSELNARIQAMQARIHPHFLFNSLNNVVSLITIDPPKAEHLLINLSRLFRASFKELKLVSLKEEIDLCQHYLEIESIRLGERLEVDWRLENQEKFSVAKIPLLTLQPLLENSIFHGVEKNPTKSRISILIEVVDNQVNIVIINPYNSENNDLTQGHGIAVENVKQRLRAYFGQTATFQSYSGKGIFTTVVQYHYK